MSGLIGLGLFGLGCWMIGIKTGGKWQRYFDAKKKPKESDQ